MSFAATVTAEELDRDPDPILARLREEEPVAWIPALQMWFVTRWDDVQAMEDQPEIFSAATEPSFLARTLGENMLTLDPPACTRLQKACKPPFLRAGRSGSFAERELPGALRPPHRIHARRRRGGHHRRLCGACECGLPRHGPRPRRPRLPRSLGLVRRPLRRRRELRTRARGVRGRPARGRVGRGSGGTPGSTSCANGPKPAVCSTCCGPSRTSRPPKSSTTSG